MSGLGQIIVSMIGTIAVIDLIAIILQGTKRLEKVYGDKNKRKRAINFGIIGGLFGIYATINGYSMRNGAIIAIRDVGPMMAGCLGGPVGGFIAGIIAGLHRLSQGFGDITVGTTIPCSISTLLIGLICGLLFKPFKENKRRGRFAFGIAFLMEMLHLFIVFIYIWMTKDIYTSWNLIVEVAPLFLLSNAISFGLMIYTTDMIDRYKLVEKNKEKIENELDTATEIQKSMLPEIKLNFPGRDEFDIYASMTPAKQVGGDFYDFYFIDDNHFVFLIGDVSGKGVPAALFMAISKIVIKNNLQLGLNLDDAIEKSNIQLSEGNKEGMFVTAWIGIIEISTGKVKYVNAGHNPPVLKKANNEISYLKNRSGFILAGKRDSKYSVFELQLEIDDILFMYTDGVTEANNKKQELYGEERLINSISKQNNNMEKMCQNIKSDIDEFAHGTEQFDDITMIGFKYNGRKI